MIVMHSDCTLIFCNYHHSLIQSLFCIIVKSYILLYSTQRQYDINISDVIIFMTLFMHCINEKLFKMDSVHKGENIFISTEIFCIVICIIAKHAFSHNSHFWLYNSKKPCTSTTMNKCIKFIFLHYINEVAFKKCAMHKVTVQKKLIFREAFIYFA